jgi:tRNA threonylcarbamoyl adenosine modification protein YjeE
MSTQVTVITNSAEHTERLGETVAQMNIGGPIFLHGELAAGKTAFVRGFVRHFSATAALEVQSPTYAFMNSYPTSPMVHHLDLYRVENFDAFLDLGLEEAFVTNQIACVEWPKQWLQQHYSASLSIYFKHVKDDIRELEFLFTKPPKNYDVTNLKKV